MLPSETDLYTPLVARFFTIQDITNGDPQKNYLVRYRGALHTDSIAAYDQLTTLLQPLGLTPLFRTEKGQQVIYLVKSLPRPRPSNPWVNVIMLLLTIFSVTFVGAISSYTGSGDFLQQVQYALVHLWKGAPFAASLMAILLAHEFGHYLVGRWHKTHVTLPYFIPMPLPPFGTMGAVIQMKELPRNRRILLDIGLAGPLAGLAVAIPILLLGLSMSQVGPINPSPGEGFVLEGNSLLYLFLKYLSFGQLLPAPASYDGVAPLLYWLRYYLTATPLPVGGTDVFISPVAWAGWAGLLVTSLNLIPAGQLDGGHILYVLIGSRMRQVWPVVVLILGALGIFWMGWWLWALIILLFGRFYDEPLDQITLLNPGRKALALFGMLIFILVFIPVPLVEGMNAPAAPSLLAPLGLLLISFRLLRRRPTASPGQFPGAGDGR